MRDSSKTISKTTSTSKDKEISGESGLSGVSMKVGYDGNSPRDLSSVPNSKKWEQNTEENPCEPCLEKLPKCCQGIQKTNLGEFWKGLEQVIRDCQQRSSHNVEMLLCGECCEPIKDPTESSSHILNNVTSRCEDSNIILTESGFHICGKAFKSENGSTKEIDKIADFWQGLVETIKKYTFERKSEELLDRIDSDELLKYIAEQMKIYNLNPRDEKEPKTGPCKCAVESNSNVNSIEYNALASIEYDIKKNIGIQTFKNLRECDDGQSWEEYIDKKIKQVEALKKRYITISSTTERNIQMLENHLKKLRGIGKNENQQTCQVESESYYSTDLKHQEKTLCTTSNTCLARKTCMNEEHMRDHETCLLSEREMTKDNECVVLTKENSIKIKPCEMKSLIRRNLMKCNKDMTKDYECVLLTKKESRKSCEMNTLTKGNMTKCNETNASPTERNRCFNFTEFMTERMKEWSEKRKEIMKILGQKEIEEKDDKASDIHSDDKLSDEQIKE